MNHDQIVRADWNAMDATQQRAYFGDNGFLLVPGALDQGKLSALYHEIQAHGFSGVVEDVWDAPSFVGLIDNDRVLAALRVVLGDDLRFFKAAYISTPPGTVRQALHLDQHTASHTGDFRNTCASWINVGFYLTDLTPEHAPLWVVPGSNKRYDLVPQSDLEYLMDEAKMVLARAGDAVLFHRSTVHAGGANRSAHTRHSAFLSYRPAWAKPLGPVPEWPAALVEKIPPAHRALVLGLNDGY